MKRIFTLLAFSFFLLPSFVFAEILYTNSTYSLDQEVTSAAWSEDLVASFTITTDTLVSSSTPAMLGFYLRVNSGTPTNCVLFMDTRQTDPPSGFQYLSFASTTSITTQVNVKDNVPTIGDWYFLEVPIGRYSGSYYGLLTPATYYTFITKQAGGNCSTLDMDIKTSSAGNMTGYISTNGTLGGFSSTTESTLTRFVVVDPADEDTIATGTPVSFEGYLYINEDDIEDGDVLTDGWWIEIRYRRNAENQLAVANISLLDTILRIDQDFIATYNDFSTTTTITNEGRYNVRWSLHRPSVLASISSFFGLEAYYDPSIVASYNSSFIAGELLPYDEYVLSFEEGIENSFASTTLSTLTARLDTCNPLSNFSMVDCLVGLFTLDPTSSEVLINQFRSSIAEKVPIGYVTRLVTILTTETATSSLPTIAFTFPSQLPLGGETLNFDFNQILSDSKDIASSTLVTEGGENVWDILMPIIDIIFYLILFFVILNDITGIHKNSKHTK